MPSASDTSPPGALPVRIEAHSFRVDDLVRRVLSGAVRIPSVEQDLQWSPDDALALLDSIDRGYPIGALLLWRRPGKQQRLEYGTVVVDAPEADETLWVVDGQQRLTSMIRILAGAGSPTEPFAAFYNLARGEFKRLSPHTPPEECDLPLAAVLDPAQTMSWLDAHPAARPHRQLALGLGKRLGKFEIPVHVVTTLDGRIVRDIYRRINKPGKRGADRQVFERLDQAAGPTSVELTSVASELAALDFGPLSESVLYNMLLATRGTDLSKEQLSRLTQDQLQESMLALARCARAALHFLRHDAGIPHVSVLPYETVLFVLARFFHRHPHPHPRSRELLARWLWRGAITGAHDNNPSRVERMLLSVENDEHDAVQALLRELPNRPPLLFSENSSARARLAMTLLAMLALGPRDLFTGELVEPAPDELGRADAYPALLRTIVPGVFDGADTLANRMLHPPVDAALVDAIIDCESPDLLATHGISMGDRQALEENYPDHFILARKEELSMIVSAFLWRRAQWDEPDTPPVEALHIGGA